MSNKVEKCVMVIDSELPTGVIANTSAILGITLGKRFPEQVGNDVTDASEKTHLGIITVPVPILKGSREMLKELRENLYKTEFNDLTVVDFSDVAQGCITYDDYISKAAEVSEEDHAYLGIAIYGDKKKINKLTGAMPLLR
ncbi:MAG: DUF2000 domain-containing protein [Synergistaceae bacterium]|nr:DUF2000 domain-containing protein [Synergistaceae bacterium]